MSIVFGTPMSVAIPGGASCWNWFPKRDDGDGRDGLSGSDTDVKIIVTIVTTDTGSGEKVNGAYLRVEICGSKYNPNPLDFSHGKHSTAEGWQRHSSCLTASEA